MTPKVVAAVSSLCLTWVATANYRVNPSLYLQNPLPLEPLRELILLYKIPHKAVSQRMEGSGGNTG